jgi:hypothetical protein
LIVVTRAARNSAVTLFDGTRDYDFSRRDMTLNKGDWVRTDTGEEGKIVLVNRVSAFVEIPAEGKDAPLVSYLISRLTKIAPPENHKDKSQQHTQ